MGDNILLLVRGGWVPFLSGCGLWLVLSIENQKFFLSNQDVGIVQHTMLGKIICVCQQLWNLLEQLCGRKIEMCHTLMKKVRKVFPVIFEVVKTSKLSERNISLTFICTQIVPSPLPGTEGAAKKWRGLINIHKSWLLFAAAPSVPCGLDT